MIGTCFTLQVTHCALARTGLGRTQLAAQLRAQRGIAGAKSSVLPAAPGAAAGFPFFSWLDAVGGGLRDRRAASQAGRAAKVEDVGGERRCLRADKAQRAGSETSAADAHCGCVALACTSIPTQPARAHDRFSEFSTVGIRGSALYEVHFSGC